MNKPGKIPLSTITAVILAGGQSRRMGGQDKGLLSLQKRPMIEYVIDAIQPQVEHILISANRNINIYQQYGFTVVPDIIGESFGPLAGVASGMQASQTDYIVTLPCDTPLLPKNLVSELYMSLVNDKAELSVVHDGNRMQPVFALLHKTLLPDILKYMEKGGRKTGAFYAQHDATLADFSGPEYSFSNINDPEDHMTIEKYLSRKKKT